MGRPMDAPNEFRDRVCRNIRMYRILMGLTQQKLADKIGIKRGYIGLIERKKRMPSLWFVVMASEALGVSVADLMDRSVHDY